MAAWVSAKRDVLKELEDENRRLKKLVADQETVTGIARRAQALGLPAIAL